MVLKVPQKHQYLLPLTQQVIAIFQQFVGQCTDIFEKFILKLFSFYKPGLIYIRPAIPINGYQGED